MAKRAGRITTSVCVLAAVAGSALSATSAGAKAKATATDTASVAYQINAAHDGGQVDPQFALPLKKQWAATFEGNIGYPLIAEHRVFVVAEHHGTKKGASVSALNLDTGAPLWGPVDIGGTHSKFGAIAYDGGRVFGYNGDGGLTAIDAATGAVDWSESLPDQYATTSPPTATNGVVYVTGSGSTPSLFAIDAATGHVDWSAAIDNGAHSAPAVDASGVYVSFDCGAYSFTTTGGGRWSTYSAACSGGQGRTVALHGGNVYTRTSTRDGALAEADGSNAQAFPGRTIPAFAGTTTLSNIGSVDAFDPAGAILWQNRDGAYVGSPIVVNGYVIAADNDGRVHAIDAATGRGKWSGRVATTLTDPDEYGPHVLTGFAEAEGHVAIPTAHKLVVFASKRPPKAG